eukprot:3874596-Rhodomonas_salina.2
MAVPHKVDNVEVYEEGNEEQRESSQPGNQRDRKEVEQAGPPDPLDCLRMIMNPGMAILSG